MTVHLFPLVQAAKAAHVPSAVSPSEFDDLEVRQVALGGWRVTDLLVDVEDPARLLGFIESRDGLFEVMQIGLEFSWTTFESMRDALQHLLTYGRASARTRNTGEMSWLAALPRSSFDEL